MKNIKYFNHKDFLKDFLPTLSNFCSKSPLQPSVIISSDNSKIRIVPIKGEEIVLDLDNNSLTKKEIINKVKKELEKDYPYIFAEEEYYDTEEIENMVDSGISLSEALEKNNKRIVKVLKVIRVHHKYNELDCLNLKTQQMEKYKCKIPVTNILQDAEKELPSFDKLKFLYSLEKNKGEKK